MREHPAHLLEFCWLRHLDLCFTSPIPLTLTLRESFTSAFQISVSTFNSARSGAHEPDFALSSMDARPWVYADDSAASVRASTRTPWAISSGLLYSSGRWLTPPFEGIKIIPTGHTRAIKSVSW